ncbi:MAG: hypothetical protein J7L42_02395 [Elusimicrobia bacterium]|nr:hypothetical protein [Elusimicrobiota bacterium]
MIVVVNGKLLRDGSVSPYICGEVSPQVGDFLLVKTQYGKEVAICKTSPKSPQHIKEKLPKIIKKLSLDEIKKIEILRKEEEKAKKVIRDLIAKSKIPMKLAKVCYTYDKNRIFVYYTAESRIDFRQLIKDINAALKTHVQMVQVTPVACAKIIGGIGPCGRVFCCNLYLNRIPKTKSNQPPLGPCGKTLCCWILKDEKGKNG